MWIESPRGRIRQKLHVFPGIKKGVMMATANCFYPEEPSEGYHGLFISNPNVLTNNDHLDPMYGSPDLTCLLCKVYKAKPEELTEEVSGARSTASYRLRRRRRRLTRSILYKHEAPGRQTPRRGFSL